MSPDSPSPSRQRRAWRVISCAAAILAAFSLLASVVLYSSLQASREDSIRMQCVQLNARHDQTVKALDRLLAIRARTATGRELERLHESRTNTLLLIDALAPHQNCARRVHQLAQ